MSVHVLGLDRPVGLAPVADARVHARHRDLRFRLAVLAHSVQEAVESAGGLICDRAMNGWHVTVVATDLRHANSMQILGADVVDFNEALSVRGRGPQPHALALSVGLLREQPQVRNELMDTIKQGRTEVAMWGSEWPSEMEGLVTSVEHRLTAAALAFKAQALLAGANSTVASRNEVFRMGRVCSSSPWPQDLAPAI
ncbi:hypothetical protein [Mycobacterium sp. 48b]|uniref:hypothetical protein n=1 Tax=Mycobacterium sp. 48b TaxID=3400426 RepID=UPI003AAE9A18